MKHALKFQVESGVAVPSRAADNPYPFETMKLGDSFLIPYPEEADEHERAIFWNRAQGNVQQSFRNWRLSNPKKRSRLICTTRSIDGEGLRCWLHERAW